jgi:hypothetical protein
MYAPEKSTSAVREENSLSLDYDNRVFTPKFREMGKAYLAHHPLRKSLLKN